jgi:hypothetical protein
MALRAAETQLGRRAVLAAVVVVAVLVGVVALGRWERQRQVDAELRGFARVQALVGPLDQPALSGYRAQPDFDCLVYRRGGNPFALELCFDHTGRVVEAIDRRREDRTFYSLRSEPTASTARVDRAEVDRLLRRMGATS